MAVYGYNTAQQMFSFMILYQSCNYLLHISSFGCFVAKKTTTTKKKLKSIKI